MERHPTRPDSQIAYDSAGAGPAIVFLHAGIANRRMWDDQFDVFAERFHVVRMDTRGFGESVLTEEPFAPVDDVLGVLEQLNIERAVLVGCSLGGRIAIDVALSAPERVPALVLVGSGLGGYSFTQLPPEAAECDAAFEAGDFARAAELDMQVWIDGPRRSPHEVDPAVRARALAMAEDNYHRAASGPEPAVRWLDPPASGRLDEIRVPTLVLVGEEDQPDIHAVGALLASGIPDAHMVILPNAAHLPNMERPAEFNRIVLEFLDGVTGQD